MHYLQQGQLLKEVTENESTFVSLLKDSYIQQ